MLASIKNFSRSSLARNTSWMFLGQGLRLLIQALYFAVIARGLGVSGYGAFVGVVALIGILFPFATCGSGFLIIKNVSRDPLTFPVYWGRALLTTAGASAVLFTMVLLFVRLVLPSTISLSLVILIACSDLFAMSLTTLCWQAFQAFERLHWTAAINVILSASRLTAAAILVFGVPKPSVTQWGSFYLGSTALAALIAFTLVMTKLGAPTFNVTDVFSEVKEGLHFSTSLSAQTIYNDIDKTMLARLGTLPATGIYGAAYRLIDVSFAPVSSLLAATYPIFFRTGVNGVSATLRYARPLMTRALGYASLVCVAMLLGAGAIPYFLGSEYRLTEEALRWLAVLPILKTIHFFLSDALTGAGYTGLRSAIQVGVAIFNILLNLWIIPAYSWRGAAWSSLASDTLLACAIGTAVFVLSRSQPSLTEPDPLQVRAEA